ncbi:MAG TPA: hypothetical protein VFY93_08625 [Planctomycetota bacterium]|nr:hypothetical protein [Planctomycetota bacterium]
MFGGSEQTSSRGAPALVTGFTILALGAMAAAIPPARLAPTVTGVERGCLVSSASFSDMMAEFLNGQGYTYMAIDCTRVPLGTSDAWRRQFDAASRIFPVWGWVDMRGGVEQARKVAASLSLSGLFLYGAKPGDVEVVRAAKPGLRVVPVVRAGETWAGEGEAATAFLPANLAGAASAKLPVLFADQLSPAERSAARATLKGNYLLSTISVLD